MSIEAVKRKFALRRKLRKRGRQRETKEAGRIGRADAGRIGRIDEERDDAGADIIALAAELETMMAESETAAGDADASVARDRRDAEAFAETLEEPPRETLEEQQADPEEPQADPEDGAVRKARAELDDMRKLWRRMRRDLPRMPACSVKRMRKDDLAAQLLSVIGVGPAPLPAWGCPEGIEAYMERLMAYLSPLAGARRCSPDALEFPLGSGRWDEDLVFSLLVHEPSATPPRAEQLRVVVKLSRPS